MFKQISNQLKSMVQEKSWIADLFTPRLSISNRKIVKSPSYSQYGQDIFLSKLLDLLPFREEYFFVDIGAHDGITFSNSKFLEDLGNWTGVCIEANSTVFIDLLKNRPDSTCINIAISDSDGEEIFLSNSGYTEMLSGLVSKYEKKHMLRIKNEIKDLGGSSVESWTQTKKLSSLLRDMKRSRIDLLMIDTEGSESAIINSFNFDEVEVEMILVERNYSSRPIYSNLTKQGYVRLIQLGQDDLYLKSNLLGG